MTTIQELKQDKIEAERKIAQIMSDIKNKHGVRLEIRAYWDSHDVSSLGKQEYYYFPIVKIESDL